jgi:ribonuclease R
MFMRERLGEEYGGTVTAATSFGLFVTLDGLYVEGLIHITELGGEYYRFDEARQELRGERSGVRYGVGARVRVQVSRVDLDARKIDFRLVKEGEDARPAVGAAKRRSREVSEGFGSAQEELAAIQIEDRAGKRAVRAQAKSGKTSGNSQRGEGGRHGGASAGGAGGHAGGKASAKKAARKQGKPKSRR